MKTNEIGDFLKSLRKSKGLTQTELADMLNISNKTISKWESGSGIPEISTLLLLADLYEITVDDILRGSRKMLKNEDKREHRFEYLIKKIKHQYQNHLILHLSLLGLSFVLLFIIGSATYNSTAAMGVSIVLVLLVISLQIYHINQIKYKLIEIDQVQKSSIFQFIFNSSFLLFAISLSISMIALTYNMGTNAIPTQAYFLPRILPIIAGVSIFSLVSYWLIRLLFHFDFLRKPTRLTLLIHVSLAIIVVIPFIIVSVFDAKKLAVSFELSSIYYTSYDIDEQEDQYFELKLLSIISEARKEGVSEIDVVELIEDDHGNLIRYRFSEPKRYTYITSEIYFIHTLVEKSMNYLHYDVDDNLAKAYWSDSTLYDIQNQTYSFITINLLGIYQIGLIGYLLYHQIRKRYAMK